MASLQGMARGMLLIGAGLILTATFVTAGCGGSLSKGDVINSTASLPDVVPAEEECVWTVEQPKNGTAFYIYFKELSLQPGDTFSVYDGENSDESAAPKIATLSGTADPSVVVYTTQKKTQLKFLASSVQTNASRSFLVSFSVSNCDVFVNSYSSSIAAPLYVPQPGAINCTYHISSNHDASVVLSFNSVNVTKGTLKVWDGKDKKSKPVIDQKDPVAVVKDVISSGANLTMELSMSSARAKQTMNAGFTSATQACTKTITVDGPMTLSSPGYPSKYTSNLNCRWILKVPENETRSIKAMFADLDLGSVYDYVVVNAGGARVSPSFGTFTKGSPPDKVMVSAGGMMYIELHTDETPGGRGFNLALILSEYDQALFGSGRLELVPELNVTQEDASVVQDDDIFYQLMADASKQVELRFNTTGNSLLPTSQIQVFDGSSPRDPLLARFTSDTPFYTLQSTGQKMLVLLSGFRQNGTFSATQTFNAEFSSVEQGGIATFTDVSGQIHLDSQNATTNKTWLIQNFDSNDTIALRIHSLDLDDGDVFTIYDGLSEYDAKMVTLVNDVINMPSIYARQFRIDYFTPGPGPPPTPAPNKTEDALPVSKPVLSASYEVRTPCGGEFTTGAGVVSSPEWPNRYPFNAHCSWVFLPLNQTVLHLAFNKFSLFAEHSLKVIVRDYTALPGNKTTNQTHVVITNTTVALLTGEKIPSDVMIDFNATGNVTSREVIVEFSSLYSGDSQAPQVAEGFQMQFEYLNSGCSKNVTNGTVISTPGYPNAVKNNLSCLWIISEPPRDDKVNTTVNVIKYSLELAHVTVDNSTNSLEIRDGGSVFSTEVPLKLKDGKIEEKQSRTNHLWIKYSYTKLNNSSDGGFAFKLTFKNQKCPKEKQCDNGNCMQDSWKCNGVNDCGDMSDERDCTCTSKGKKQYSGLVLGMSIVATAILTLILAFAIPIIYKRIKYPNYSELRDLMAPVDS